MINDTGQELHQLIKSGDTLALAKLYDLYSENVINALRHDFSDLSKQDNDFILEAVNEAFLGYYNNANSFDPLKKTLKSFLIFAAKRDLVNIISREKRYKGKINIPEDVEVAENIWNNIKKQEQSADEGIIMKETTDLIDDELGVYFTDETDIELAKMILRGERETEAFAIVLKYEGLEKFEKQAEVKKNKDRIKKILDRNQIELKLKRILQ